MLSNEVMVQVSAENALRGAQHRAWWAVVKRMYAVDMQCWYPLVSTPGMRVRAVPGAAGVGAFGAAGMTFGAAGVGAYGVLGRGRVAGRLPGLHSGPSPPAVGFSAPHHR